RGVIHDEGVRAADRRGVAADRGAVLVEDAPELVRGLHRRRGGRPDIAAPDVGVLRGDAQRALGAIAADPYRRMRLLHRLRPRDGASEPVIPALEGRPGRGPEKL